MIHYKVNKIEMATSNGGKIKYWTLSKNVTIFPHLELEQSAYTYNEMWNLCHKLKDSLPDLQMVIYDKSDYCYELNGPWNVCFSIYDPENSFMGKQGFSYTYIIRSCNDFNKTYGCPVVNLEYVDKLKTLALTYATNLKLWNIIETKLIELIPNSKKVNYFDT